MRKAALLLAIALLIGLAACSGKQNGTAEPSGLGAGSADAHGSPSDGATTPAVPSPTPRVPGAWTVVAAFAPDDGLAAARDVTAGPSGYIAVGVSYPATTVNNVGPQDPRGRVWRSPDGSSWEDVTPAGTFDGAVLHTVVTLDGGLVALGYLRGADGQPDVATAWASQDGDAWQVTDLGISGSVRQLVVGDVGALALVDSATGVPELWHAAPGGPFAYADAPPPLGFWASVAAGPDGFVVTAARPSVDSDETVAFISSDGSTWLEADLSPTGSIFTAPLGPDWVAAGPGEGSSTPSWASGNGVRWDVSGAVPLASVAAGDMECREMVRELISAGDVVLAPTTFSYPCSEGRAERFGQVLATTDGATWSALPFTQSTQPEDPAGRGTTVHGATATDDGVVLVGESDGRATFWVRRGG